MGTFSLVISYQWINLVCCHFLHGFFSEPFFLWCASQGSGIGLARLQDLQTLQSYVLMLTVPYRHGERRSTEKNLHWHPSADFLY